MFETTFAAVGTVTSGAAYVVKTLGVPATVTASSAVVGSAAPLFVVKALGFTAAGPAAGTWAATTMSAVALANGGAVPAASTYACVQSFAMGGALLGALPGVAGAAVVASAVVRGAQLWLEECPATQQTALCQAQTT